MEYKIKSVRPMLFDRFTGTVVEEKDRKENMKYIIKGGIENCIFDVVKA